MERSGELLGLDSEYDVERRGPWRGSWINDGIMLRCLEDRDIGITICYEYSFSSPWLCYILSVIIL